MFGYTPKCPSGTWLPKGQDKCTKCTILPSKTKNVCGQDETTIGQCAGTTNSLKCKACGCAGGAMSSAGVCECSTGQFKSGDCKTGFKCKSCENDSKQCDTEVQHRTGVCGSSKKPYNTYDCADCTVQGKTTADCGPFQFRTGKCTKATPTFKCEPQPQCAAGQHYQPGESKFAKASCEPCEDGTFMATASHRKPACQKQRAACDSSTGEHVSAPANSTADLVCKRHTPCDARTEYEVSEPDANNDRECKAISDCPPGTYVSANFTKTTDRTCEACDGVDGYTDAPNLSKCKAVDQCRKRDSLVVTAAIPSSDLECGSCPDGEEQLARRPHRATSCTEITSTTTTTTITTTTTVTTTTAVDKEVLAVVEKSMATVEKVQNAVQECDTALGTNGEAAFCMLDAENCFFSCEPVKALHLKMTKRLDAVQAQDEGTGTSGFKTSALTPKEVPEWCADEDTQCAAYGEDVCKTPGAYSCAKYCGCRYKKVGGKYVAATTAPPPSQAPGGKRDDDDDDDDFAGTGAGGDGTAQGSKATPAASEGDGKKDDHSTTLVIAAGVGAFVVFTVCIVAGAVVFVAQKNARLSVGQPQAFSNPVYTSGETFDQPQYAAANANAGYMDVQPHQRH